jgi:hypothetical protein
VKPVQMSIPYEDETININYNIMVRKYIWIYFLQDTENVWWD